MPLIKTNGVTARRRRDRGGEGIQRKFGLVEFTVVSWEGKKSEMWLNFDLAVESIGNTAQPCSLF